MVLPESNVNAGADGDEHDPPPKGHVPQPPSDIKPTNHLSLDRRNGRIEGAFVIDPRLKVLAQMLARLEKDETDDTRRNLSLRALAQDGSIDADVWVLSDDDNDNDEKVRGRVRIWASARKGVSLRLHSAHAPRAPPLTLSLHSNDGSISLSLPRTFCGPLISSDGVRKCFVGSGWADAPGKWTGDEAQVDSDHGNVWIQFDDEEQEKKASFAVFMGVLGVVFVLVFGVFIAFVLPELQNA
ncbi:hypothetical protein C8F01DRAFT_1193551 [Mycena amicta]|nr:hypothetical protein C8F01DRAFT_1193551 [Mycena amicta]